ncbi:hypothetical protein SAMN02927937_01821 [Paenimyroides aquimaris]|uniref:Uncharacterized protein n=1 Tax=Paenimyroides marinum TaxID=1159016 RepID=A0A1H6LNB5_9FLAO|nr:hypothetical protein [Paenimyroides aquimaris]SEH86224.1 hypothetical protein SAMN02927937_01821 [Paenimyroides aquimaris]
MKEIGINFLLTFFILLVLLPIGLFVEGLNEDAIFHMMFSFTIYLLAMSLINALILTTIDTFVTNTKRRLILTFLPSLIMIFFFLQFLTTISIENKGLFVGFPLIIAVFSSNFLRYKRINKHIK